MSPRIDISIDELPEASSLLDGHDYSSRIIQRIAGVPVILDVSGCPHSPFFEVEYDDRTIRLTNRHDNEHIIKLGKRLDYVHHHFSGFLKTFFLRMDRHLLFSSRKNLNLTLIIVALIHGFACSRGSRCFYVLLISSVFAGEGLF